MKPRNHIHLAMMQRSGSGAHRSKQEVLDREMDGELLAWKAGWMSDVDHATIESQLDNGETNEHT